KCSLNRRPYRLPETTFDPPTPAGQLPLPSAAPSPPHRSAKMQLDTSQYRTWEHLASVHELARRRPSPHQGDSERCSLSRADCRKWERPDSNGLLRCLLRLL